MSVRVITSSSVQTNFRETVESRCTRPCVWQIFVERFWSNTAVRPQNSTKYYPENVNDSRLHVW